MFARTALAAVALLLTLQSAARAATPPEPATRPTTVPALPPGFLIQSHRGAGELAPENTPEAFELAWKLGTIPEADVRTTRDGVLVAFHDSDFSRVVKGADDALKKKGVEDLTWAELSKLDVGSFRGERFAGQRVSTLAEAFAVMAGHPDRRLYLDVKKVELPKLAELVRQHKVERQVFLASTKHDLIRQWKSLVPDSGTLHWMGGTEDALRKRIDDLRKTDFAGVTQLQIHVRLVKGKDVAGPDPFTPSDAFLAEVGRELKARGIVYQTLPWNTAEPRVYWKLLDLGVNSFATDYPEATVAAVAAYYARNADAAKPADKDLIQGTWKVVGRVKNGKAAPDKEVQEHPVLLTFAGDAMTETKEGKPLDEGTFKLDADKSPKRITMTGKDGRAFEGIYELAGDTLKIAYGIKDKAAAPPADFTGGEGSGLLVLERQKPAKAAADDAKAILGKWRAVDTFRDGERVVLPPYVISETSYFEFKPDGTLETVKGDYWKVYAFRLDSGTTPKQLDMGDNRPRPVELPVYYELDGDTLRIGHATDWKAPMRPTNLTPVKGLSVTTYERVKP